MIILKTPMIVDVQFFLRGKGKVNPQVPAPIYAQVDCEGSRSTAFATGMKIPSMYWLVPDQKNGKLKSSTVAAPCSKSYYLADQINEKISSIRKSANDAKGVLQALDEDITADAIKALVTAKRKILPKIQFMSVLDELRVVLAITRVENTMKNYRTRRNNIKEFLLAQNDSKMTVDKFRYQHFEMMQSWMHEQKTDDGKPRWGRNTINKHLTLVNQVLDYAVNKEYILTNPIGRMNLGYDSPGEPQYLRADTRQRIIDCNLKSLEKEKDVAVFLMYTGLSYTDYLTLDDDHLFRLPAGEHFIKKERDKSEVYSIIPVLPEVQKVILKYRFISDLPKPDLSDLNKMLKVLGEHCKSPLSISTSTFRETFASMMENEYMIPDRLLMFMMGHTNIRQLRNYSNVMPERVLHELKKHDIKIPFDVELYKELVKTA